MSITWTPIPAPPKVPNFHQGGGYTLHYRAKGGGWDVHEGTHATAEALGEVLFHDKTAKAAKAWVEARAASEEPPAVAKAARKRAPRKPKPAPVTEEPPGGTGQPGQCDGDLPETAITPEDVAALRDKAASAGDMEMARICDVALGAAFESEAIDAPLSEMEQRIKDMGQQGAWAECERVISSAEPD